MSRSEHIEPINAAIRGRVMPTNFGHLLAAEGDTTVALDLGGELVVRHPDGKSASAR